MYENPISEMLGEIQAKIIEQQENRVLQAVQNCGISVDKEELTKALMYDRQQYEKGYADAKAEERWIPCSERLPEDLEEVNVTWVNHDPEPYYAFVKDKPFTASAVYYKGKWYWYSSTCRDLLAEYGRNPNQEIDDGIEIIAWKPLPEPYKGEA